MPDEADDHLIERAVAAQAEANVTRPLGDVSRGDPTFPSLRILTPGRGRAQPGGGVAVLGPGVRAHLLEAARMLFAAPWFDWAVQQAVLALLLGGVSLRGAALASGRSRRTVRRWRDGLQECDAQFAFFLRSRGPELGRVAAFNAFS